MSSLIRKCMFELLASFILVFFGNSSIANDALPMTKGKGLGAGFIALHWGVGAYISILICGSVSAMTNPAVVLSELVLGNVTFLEFFLFSLAQTIGAFLASIVIFSNFLPQYLIDCVPDEEDHAHLGYIKRAWNGKTTFESDLEEITDVDPFQPKFDLNVDHAFHTVLIENQLKRLATFCTIPSFHHYPSNFYSEVLGTVFLIVGLYLLPKDAMVAGLYIFLLIATCGGPTGLAANPARDIGPRLAHYLLPIKGKGCSKFRYGMLVVLATFTGGLVSGLLIKLGLSGSNPGTIMIEALKTNP